MEINTLKKILYVEDQKDIQMIAEYALSAISSYAVKVCSSGEQALAEIGAFKPDLLLLDVMMPGMDGPETLIEIRKLDAYKDTPAVFMTAKILPNEVADLMTSGVVATIPKPFDPVTLGSEVQAIWDKLLLDKRA